MAKGADCVLVLTTLPADADVENFAAQLVEERLAACVAIHPGVRSVYRWQGEVERAHEYQLVLKTTAARAEALAGRMAALHPYEVPELLILPVTGGGEAYLRWIRAETAEEP
ncbi:MAG: divalent-cation tolerance protein CutA [Acidobacteriota bacterium]|nr:divalent-cation tolerance protein CutA [Acidobacteriota bacterium]